MSDELDLESICRDDDCDRPDIHVKHPILRRGRAIRVHHRPDPATPQLPPSSKSLPWKRNDPSGLTGAVARATSKAVPTHFSAIVRDVHDDYGYACERTVYRHVKKLVERGHLIKLDVGLAFAAYIRPKSRLLKDHDAIREYLLGLVEIGPPVTRRTRKVQAQPKAPTKPEPVRELATPPEMLVARINGYGGILEHKRVRELGREPVTSAASYRASIDGRYNLVDTTTLDEVSDVVNG